MNIKNYAAFLVLTYCSKIFAIDLSDEDKIELKKLFEQRVYKLRHLCKQYNKPSADYSVMLFYENCVKQQLFINQSFDDFLKDKEACDMAHAISCKTMSPEAVDQKRNDNTLPAQERERFNENFKIYINFFTAK